MKEYAPEYTKKEKLIRLVAIGIIGVAFGAWFKLKGLPYLVSITVEPQCFEFLGMQGAEFLAHLLFFWMPLSTFLLASLFMLPPGVRGLIDGQFPPKGMKVFRPTVIRRGKLGTFKSLGHFLLPLLCLGFSVWGYSKVEPMMAIFQSNQNVSLCTY